VPKFEKVLAWFRSRKMRGQQPPLVLIPKNLLAQNPDGNHWSHCFNYQSFRIVLP
jgi:hypothetical protein